MKTLGELIHSVTWDDLWAALNGKWFRDNTPDEEFYRKMRGMLLAMQPAKMEDVDNIDCHTVPERWFDHKGRRVRERAWINIGGEKEGSDFGLAIEFCPWPEWLDLPVKVSGPEALTEAEQLAACMDEMSWFGMPEEIEAKQNEILDRVEEVQELLAGNKETLN